MGTTADKGEYLNTTKSLLKQAINNIGGEVTDETTFRNYANQLQNVYDNLPKTEYQEGTEVNLGKTRKGKLDYDNGVVGIGQTEQDSTNGYQLINPSQLPLTTNGVTISKDTKGNIVLNGTPSISEGYINFRYSAYLNLSPNTYTLSVANKKVGIGIIVSSSEFGGGLNLTFADTSKSKSKAISNNTSTDVQVNVRYDVGTLNNFILNPMLEEGSTAHDYEQYTGGQASPSPNWEQQVKCVAGRNRLNPELLSVFGSDKFIKTDNYNTKGIIEVQPLTTYTISFDRFQGDGNLYEYDESNTLQKTTSLFPGATPKYLTFTTTANTHKLGFYACIDNNGGVTIENAKPMLCEGAEHRPYLPYNTIEEVVSGKNKFNIGTSLDDWFQTNNNGTKIGSYTINTTTATILNNTLTIDTYNNAGYNWISKWLELEKNTDYIISGTNTQSLRIIGFDSNALTTQGTLIVNKNSNLSEHTKTFNSGDYKYYCLSFYPDTAGKYFENIQIEQGSTATDYEPYKTPKTYQFSLGDYKFYGIGNYKDTIRRSSGKNKANIVNGSIWDDSGTDRDLTNSIRTDYIKFDKNMQLTPSWYYTEGDLRYTMYFLYDNNKTYISNGYYSKNTPITTTNDSVAYIKLKATGIVNGNLTIDNVQFQVEQGSTATDYQPYGVGVWYKYGKINDYKITGNEAISINTDLTNTTRIAMYTALSDKPSVDVSVKLPLSNYFVGVQNWSGDVVGIYTNSGSIVFRVPKTIATTEQEIKTWLSSHNVIVCYVLATPTYTPITGTLAEQLEELWNGQSLDGTTIIEGNGDLPMIIKVRGLKGA